MLEIAVGVATPLGLVGLACAIGYYVYSAQLRHEENKLKLLPESERSGAVDEYLTAYGMTAEGLTKQQRYDLLVREMDRRHGLSVTKLKVFVGLFAFCFVVAVYAYLQINEQKPKLGGDTETRTTLPGEATKPKEAPPVITASDHATVVTGDAGGDIVVNPPNPTVPQDEHPVIKLSDPIEEQVQLFAEDKVRIVAGQFQLTEVWFGNAWEPFDPKREQPYTVWGIPGKPVTPQFRGTGEFKLEISYTRYRDQRRDKRPHSDGEKAAAN